MAARTRRGCAALAVAAASMAAASSARAAVTQNGFTFYSTNTNLADSAGSLVWTTPQGSNAEMHTNFGPFSLAVGEQLTVSFDMRFLEPQGDGGNGAEDGIRLGLLDLATQTNADGAHAATTGQGYRFRFNWETGTATQGVIAHERTPGGSSANYLTSSGGIWEGAAANSSGFGLNADGSTSYPVTYTVERTGENDAIARLTVNGITRTFNDPGDGQFSFDTFAVAKIGDSGVFTDSSTITISNFSAAVSAVPEPGAVGLLGLLSTAALRRRARR